MSGAGAGRGWGRGGAALGAGLRGALTAQQRGACGQGRVSGTYADFFIESSHKSILIDDFSDTAHRTFETIN